MNGFTHVFLAALAAGLALQVWLLHRHARHVAAHRDQVPDSFTDSIPLSDHRKAADYTLAKVRLAHVDMAIAALILLALTLGGIADRVLGLFAASGLPPVVAGAGALLAVLFIQGLLDLPLSAWRTFRLEARFGFNRTSPRRFVLDLLLQTLVILLLAGPLALALLWLMAKTGPLWWLYAWSVWIGFSLLVTWAFPTLIAPLFNRFVPLEDGPLRRRIDALVRRCGFQTSGIFVMDGSRRSSHGNAYFTGFGKGKRIVFFDTLMARLAPEELEAVLAHELGHFKRRHILKHLGAAAVLSLAGFAVLGWLGGQDWFYQGLGVSQPSHAAALLLFLLASPVFTQFFSPLGSWLMRRHEHEADEYAAEQTGGHSLIRALVKLYQDNASTLTPDPLYSAFHDSHPPAPVRIAHISSRIAAT